MVWRTAVLLDVQQYQRLIGEKPADPEWLEGMSRPELEALANSQLAPIAQARLDELLASQKQQGFSEAEKMELDQLLAQAEQLTILKTRARYTLSRSGSIS
jgi:hypothetical protein